MTMKITFLHCPTLALTLSLSLLPGCAVVAVADAAVTVVATGVKVGTKAVGAAVDALIPDSMNSLS